MELLVQLVGIVINFGSVGGASLMILHIHFLRCFLVIAEIVCIGKLELPVG